MRAQPIRRSSSSKSTADGCEQDSLIGIKGIVGAFDIVFRTQIIASVDIRPLDGTPESAHDVSEHLSIMSPV